MARMIQGNFADYRCDGTMNGEKKLLYRVTLVHAASCRWQQFMDSGEPSGMYHLALKIFKELVESLFEILIVIQVDVRRLFGTKRLEF